MSWQEELKQNITTAKELSGLLNCTPEEQQGFAEILEQYPMSITPYYLSLINFEDEHDPIRRMCIPSLHETDLGGSFDTSGEADNTVIVGMQHKYRQTAMVLSTNQCAMYCRHCFRKRLVGLSDEEVARYFDDMIGYIRAHGEISNVLISGGDSFLNSNAVIERYLGALCDIGHLDLIRFGTRGPVVFPSRITGDGKLLDILGRYSRKKQIYVVTQYNHPRELTEASLAAVQAIRELGIPVRNQTVLLRGVNDTPETLGALLRGMTRNGILPYYVFQCRPVTGVKNQFQVPLREGYRIVESAKALQNGQGKCFRYALSHRSGKIEILGELDDERMLFKYHQAKDSKNAGRIFSLPVNERDCWIDECYGE